MNTIDKNIILKKISVLWLTFILLSLIGCNSISSSSHLPDEKPKNFSFVFNYGVNAKNQLDTISGKYTKDMIIQPSVITDMKLSDEEMKSIYSDMKKINIFNYPDNFNPRSNMMQTPYETYSIKIIINGVEKDLYWKDESASQNKEAVQLRELFKKMEKIIANKEEYKKLPAAKGGYD